MKSFVISLSHRPERLQRFLGWNARHDLDFQVATAVDGRNVDRAALVAEGILDPEHSQFTDGALGNALSHRGQWLDCIADGQPRLICEDDACLRGDIGRQMPLLERALAGVDLLFLGYNTDAPLALLLPDGLATETYFGVQPAAHDRFAVFAANGSRRPHPALHRALSVWGTIAYGVTPAGARRLLQACFPLSSACSVRQHTLRRQVRVAALDGMINWGLSQDRLRAVACLPPLALSPNDISDVNAAAACPSP